MYHIYNIYHIQLHFKYLILDFRYNLIWKWHHKSFPQGPKTAAPPRPTQSSRVLDSVLHILQAPEPDATASHHLRVLAKAKPGVRSQKGWNSKPWMTAEEGQGSNLNPKTKQPPWASPSQYVQPTHIPPVHPWRSLAWDLPSQLSRHASLLEPSIFHQRKKK